MYKNTTDSFIFNFTDGKNVSTAKLGVGNASHAVYCDNNFGPHMGEFGYNGSVWFKNGFNQYSNIDIPENLTIDYYEVFQVIKK